MPESFWKSCIFVHFSRFGGRKFAWNFAKIWVLRRCTARSRRDPAVCEERIREFIDRVDIWLLEDSHFLSVRSQAYEHLWSKSKYSGAQLEDLQGLVICSCLATRRWIRKVEMVESERSFFFLKRRRILKILSFRNGGAPNFSVALKTCIFHRFKR